MARSVWSLSSEETVDCMYNNLTMNAKNWVFTLYDKLEHEEFTRMVVTLWAIWRARRKVIHEDIYQTPFATHSFINFFLNDLEFIEKKAPKLIKVPVIQPSGWLPPPEGLSKINADAVVGGTGDHGAVSVVCSDQEGSFLGA